MQQRSIDLVQLYRYSYRTFKNHLSYSSLVSLRKSFNLSQNLTLELFIYGITVMVLNAAGILLMGVGFIFSHLLTTMATALIYKGLKTGGDSIPEEPYRVSR